MFDMTFKCTKKAWRFPQERFVTYEESDEAWCRYFGIGKEIDVVENVTIGNVYIRSISPDGTMRFSGILNHKE